MTQADAVIAARKAEGFCVALFSQAQDYPQTAPVAELVLDHGGIPGTRHHGFTRKAGAREPWYPRGMQMRSGRQITVVSQEELGEIARTMGIERVSAEWIGANILVRGIAHLSWLPAGTRLVFSEAVLVVEGQNAPCRVAGRAIARNLQASPEQGIDLAFAKAAAALRGVVATVEKPGTIRGGERMVAKIPPQRIWQDE